MGEKSKFDYEIEDFAKAFSRHRDKKIALYGTGRMTATLLGGLDGYQIIGLCDRDGAAVGTQIYGKPVLDREAVEREADILVINTSATYWNTIFQRIREWNIPIYYRNGELAASKACDEYRDDPYWDKTWQDLRAEIAKHEVISFDIFDTLLTRRVLSPGDVFRLTEKRLERQWNEGTGFAAIRSQAAASLSNPTLDEIYQRIQELTGASDERIATMKACEIDTDRQLISGREEMLTLCREVLRQKEVYFISDMYYPSQIILEMLEQAGLSVASDRLIVSCEHKRAKADGSLWEWYRTQILADRSALHIGDDKNSDRDKPALHNVHSFQILSAFAMLERSSLGELAHKAASLQASLAVGSICARLFGDPFTLNAAKGAVRFRSEADAGYCLLGNIAYSFILWLLKRAKEDGIDQILFFAREGYLLIEQYRYVCELLKEHDVADAVYLEISRRAIWAAAIETAEDLYEVAAFPFEGSVQKLLHNRFGVELDGSGLEDISAFELQKNQEKLRQTLGPYVDTMLQHTLREKKAYLDYLSGLGLKEELAVVDGWAYGSTQHYFQKLIGKSVRGYYLCACLDASNRYFMKNDMKGCFQSNDDPTGKNCWVRKNSHFMEAFFTAPYGMLTYMDENGKSHYADEMSNQRNYGVRLKMQEGIFQFLEEQIGLYKGLHMQELPIDEAFADQMFGCMMQGGFIPLESMKNSFFHDSQMLNNRESPIW